MLIQTRQVIHQISHSYGLRATLHPQPLPGAGTGAHVHISINSPRKPEEVQRFQSGLLAHMKAICAFGMPQSASYKRVTNNAWTCGTWVCHAYQNREVPLRVVKDAHWEVRCVDGTANMYLVLAAVIAAGCLGIQNKTPQSTKPVEGELPVSSIVLMAQLTRCVGNPASLSEAQLRDEYGVTEKLPTTLESALQALKSDTALVHALDDKIPNDLITMKQAESVMLGAMSEQDRQIWLIERY